MNNNSLIQFNLIEVIKIANKWKLKILAFAVAVAAITAVYAWLQKNNYESYANFYPANGIIGSRDNLFRTEFQDAIDQFGLENESDRIIAIGMSPTLMSGLITKFNLDKHYGIDLKNDPKASLKLFKKFAKNYRLSKGALGNIELVVIDVDMTLAADIAQAALVAIQDQFRSYYVKSGEGIAEAIKVRMQIMDTTIATLTDSLVNMREKYGIYEIISPSRKGDVHVNSTNARGIEEVQTVEEFKDKLVMDKAKYESLRNEFLTVQHKSIPFIHVIQYPSPSGKKVWPFRTLMVVGAGAVAVFVGLLLAVVITYYSKLKHLFVEA